MNRQPPEDERGSVPGRRRARTRPADRCGRRRRAGGRRPADPRLRGCRQPAPADLAIQRASLQGFDGDGSCAAGTATAARRTPAPRMCTCPRRPADGPYWDRPDDGGRAVFASDAPFGLPFRPSPFRARIELAIERRPGDARNARAVPLRWCRPGRRETDGAQGGARPRRERVAAHPGRAAARVPAAGARSRAARTSRELRVTVINGREGPEAAGSGCIRPPAGG